MLFRSEALEACVKLTDRYITDRNFPDKAIDALDEAGSRVHLTNVNVPKEIEEQEKLIEEAKSKKNEAVKSQNFELAASFRDKEKELSVQLDEMKKEWEANLTPAGKASISFDGARTRASLNTISSTFALYGTAT